MLKIVLFLTRHGICILVIFCQVQKQTSGFTTHSYKHITTCDVIITRIAGENRHIGSSILRENIEPTIVAVITCLHAFCVSSPRRLRTLSITLYNINKFIFSERYQRWRECDSRGYLTRTTRPRSNCRKGIYSR